MHGPSAARHRFIHNLHNVASGKGPIKSSPLRPSPLSISVSVDTDVLVDSNPPFAM